MVSSDENQSDSGNLLDLGKSLQKRLEHPVLGAVAVCLFFANWDLWVTAFSGGTAEGKILMINSRFCFWVDIVAPTFYGIIIAFTVILVSESHRRALVLADHLTQLWEHKKLLNLEKDKELAAEESKRDQGSERLKELREENKELTYEIDNCIDEIAHRRKVLADRGTALDTLSLLQAIWEMRSNTDNELGGTWDMPARQFEHQLAAAIHEFKQSDSAGTGILMEAYNRHRNKS